MSNYPDGFGSSPRDYGSQSPLDTEDGICIPWDTVERDDEKSYYDHNYYFLSENINDCSILYMHGNSNVGYLYSLCNSKYEIAETYYGYETELNIILEGSPL